ncbi:MAG: hypothetical protein GXP32_09420 [Kiritimatiellaeota bacterium]|nr:hypothetical protein [Kiritimatiellota bacterium]
MRLKTIFNKCCKFKSFFVTGARFDEKEESIARDAGYAWKGCRGWTIASI